MTDMIMLEIGDLHNVHVDGAYQEGQHLATDKRWVVLYACLCVSKQAINYSAGVEVDRTNIQTPFVGALFKVVCRNLKRKGTMRIYSTGTGGPRGKSVTEEGGREVSLHWNFVFDVDRECSVTDDSMTEMLW